MCASIHETSCDAPATAARRLHPEDIRTGQLVMVLGYGVQFPSFLWVGLDSTTHDPALPIQVNFRECGEQRILKVTDICIPFVLCESIDEKPCVLDLRQLELALIPEPFAEKFRDAFLKSQRKAKSDEAKKAKRKKKSGRKKR